MTTDVEDEPPIFTIGLTMAGAVSAGAYTAGVLDYLFRAIDAHTALLNKGGADAPNHRVVVKVISGTSAGGVCSGLTIPALIKAHDPDAAPGGPMLRAPATKRYPDDETESAETPKTTQSQSYFCTLDTLHELWVERLDLWSQTSHRGLLSLNDLGRWPDPIRSVLNSDYLDRSADDVIEGTTWTKASRAFPYIASDLELFITTTNLLGAPYRVQFETGEHRMAQHSTVRHFRVTGMGTEKIASHWLDAWKDEGIPLDLIATQGKPIPFQDDSTAWARLRQASIATGAFPVGFAPRRIAAEAQDFGRYGDAKTARGGALPIDVDPKDLDLAQPDFGKGKKPTSAVPYMAVDGGVANNEPFEYARFTIRKDSEVQSTFLDPNPREGNKADRAIIMIDPFPEGPTYEDMKPDSLLAQGSLWAAVGRLLPTLLNQARWKPSELVNAASKDVSSRFIIAPKRRLGDRVLTGEHAIACGCLGGFGGFLERRFRQHDFILGQRNCQKFLRDTFVLAPDNPVLFRGGKVPIGVAATGVKRQIISPGTRYHFDEVLKPEWPKITRTRVERLLTKGDERIGIVVNRLLREKMDATRAWALSKILKNKAMKAATVQVFADLIERDHLLTNASMGYVGRLATAEMVRRGEDGITVDEAVKAIKDRELDEFKDYGPEDRNALIWAHVAHVFDDRKHRDVITRRRAIAGAERYFFPDFAPWRSRFWLTGGSK